MVKSNNNDETLISEGLKTPESIEKEQNNSKSNEIEKERLTEVQLFFSIDIVNSTMYKSLVGNWPIIIRSLLEEIKRRVFSDSDFEKCFLWRVIGDEMVFVLPITDKNDILKFVDSIFRIVQEISILLKSILLKNGDFFKAIPNQDISTMEINVLEIQTPLSIKAATWIGVVTDQVKLPYDNITFDYSASSQNQIIKEYLGRDIDAGFRLKSYTQDRRLVISFELAYLLMLALTNIESNNRSKNNILAERLHIMDYVRLKGVWNEALYPIIWYYNSEIEVECKKEIYKNNNEIETSFAQSFRYDETENNFLASNYFVRGSNGRGKKNYKKNKKRVADELENYQEFQLASSMYSIKTALTKIARDRNLNKKIDYINEVLDKNTANTELNNMCSFTHPFACPLEMHCAVVCCDIENEKVLIVNRNKNFKNLEKSNRWEFGCARAVSKNRLEETITEYYKTNFGVEIKLILDNSREEKQPVPIAFYEIPREDGNIKKGIIFVAEAKIKKGFRSTYIYDEIKWISREEIDDFSKEDTVNDFHNTLNTVFNRFTELFGLKEGK